MFYAAKVIILHKILNRDDMKVAIVGASGAVGQEFLRVLEERNFPIDDRGFFCIGRNSYGLCSIECRIFFLRVDRRKKRKPVLKGN